jgi:phosphohistidine phosphatase SixA
LSVPGPSLAQEGVVVYLVRHAEVEPDGTSDPSLSEMGWERATLLATMLRDAGITDIHSTDLNRTRETGSHVAAATALEIHVYDPSDLQGFADRLRETPGRHLVLGHSNTTPEVVAALGGDPGTPIDEDEFDRFYVVTIGPDFSVTTVLLRYGAAYPG